MLGARRRGYSNPLLADEAVCSQQLAFGESSQREDACKYVVDQKYFYIVTAQAYQEVIIPWCKTDKNRAQ
jgi:hypothetical protein